MTRPKWILLTEDNEHDVTLALRALLTANQPAESVIVARDGVEALDCLYGRGAFQTRAGPDLPALVLLDLKMPRVNGLEVLRALRADPRFKRMPVVMFTSSQEQTDVAQCYDLGANAYVVKPVDFKQFMSVINETRKFWMDINELAVTPIYAVAEHRAQSAGPQPGLAAQL